MVASTAAMAQGVTIYGTLEGGLANTTGRGTYFSGAGGFNGGSWIGFKGQEDLGGGTKAFFNLEAGIDLNGYSNNGGASIGISGNETDGYLANSPIFSRQSNIGLTSESMGTLTVGQQLSPFIASVAGTGTLGNGHFFVNRHIMGGGFAPAALTGAANASYEGFFIPNSFSYATPSLGGFTATVLGSTATGNTRGAVPDKVASEGVRYEAASLTGAVGGVNVSAAYQRIPDFYRTWALSANTNLAGFTVAGNYMHNKFNENTEAVKSWNIGVGYDVMPALNVSLQYARVGAQSSVFNIVQDSNAALESQTLTGLSAKYTLSKRTALFASLTRATNGAQSSYDRRGEYTNNGNNNRTTAIGVLHSF